MPKERLALTEPLLAEIVVRIEAGAYPHIAAEACGVPADVFTDWLTRYARTTKKRPPKPIFKKLAQAVRQAQGHARCRAEMTMLSDDAKTWLLSGPGKESDGRPGWSVPAKPAVQTTNDNRTVNVLMDPHLQGLFAGILEVLAPFPEARQAVARAILERGSGHPGTTRPHRPNPTPARPAC